MDAAAAASPDKVAAPPLTALKHKHLLGIADLSAEEIVLILDTAEAMKEVGRRTIKKVPTLRGRTVINLFFEPSTRTRTSFEIASKRRTGEAICLRSDVSLWRLGPPLPWTAAPLLRRAPALSFPRT